jgi:hypothetical protein
MTTQPPPLIDDATQHCTDRWIRIPAKGQCPWCGLTRSMLFRLVRENRIKSRSLKNPGCVKGTRLLWLPSVHAYIENCNN